MVDSIAPVANTTRMRDKMSGTMSNGVVMFRTIVGVVLAYSGMIHLGNPYAFLATVLRYEVFDSSIAVLIAASIPIIQILIGVLLMLWRPMALIDYLAASLFVSFSVMQWIALQSDAPISCGCFGISSGNISVLSAIGVTLTAAAMILIASKTRYSEVSRERVDSNVDCETRVSRGQ